MTQSDKWKKRPAVMRYRAWKDAARAACGKPLDAGDVISLSWRAFFEMPKSWSKTLRAAHDGAFHRSKPDRDNIDKAVLDALFADDAAIAFGTIEKRWALEPRLEVTIEILCRTEPELRGGE